MRRQRTYTSQFTRTAKWLHWLSALLLLTVIGAAWGFAFQHPADRAGAIPVHASIALLVVALTVLRLAWRRLSPPPELPKTTPGWMARSAKGGHRAMYALLLVQGALGLAMAALSPVDIRFFNGWDLSALAEANPAAVAVLRPLHFTVAAALTALIAVHVLAALWHHFVLRDDVLQRMLPFGGLWQRLVIEHREAERRFPSRNLDRWPRRFKWDTHGR